MKKKSSMNNIDISIIQQLNMKNFIVNAVNSADESILKKCKKWHKRMPYKEYGAAFRKLLVSKTDEEIGYCLFDAL